MKLLLRATLLSLLSACLLPMQAEQAEASSLWFTKKQKTEKLSTVRFGVNVLVPTGSDEGFYRDGVKFAEREDDSENNNDRETFNLLNTNAAGLSLGYRRLLTDYIAFEYSTSVNFADPGGALLTDANGETTAEESSSFIFLPQTITLQYHIAPYGRLIPYVGAGYNYTYIYSTGDIPYDAPHGPVIQAGFDWVGKSSLGVNLDIKQFYWGDFGGDFNDLFREGGFTESNYTSLIKDENPVVISFSVNYNF